VPTLVVEGWRASCHSFALVNQHQLLQLSADRRWQLYHRDWPFVNPHWAALDSGLPPEAKRRLAALPAPPDGLAADVTYRISYPFRAGTSPHAGRVLMFATGEFAGTLAANTVGEDGRPLPPAKSTAEIVTCSAWSKRVLTDGGFPPARVHVIPLGFDPVLARRPPPAERSGFRRSLGIADDAFVFLNVGAMTWNKGVGPLLAAFAAHRRRHPNAVLLLKGGDALYGNKLEPALAEAARLRAEAASGEFRAAVRYLSQSLTQDEMRRVYGAADAYVSPYRAEGFNLPALEAMAAGLPLIVTAGGATDDFCPPERGFRVRAELTPHALGVALEPDVAHLIEQMARVAGDAALRADVGALAREWALEHYSWASVTARLASLMLGGRA